MSWEWYALLLPPAIGGAALAWIGHRARAPEFSMIFALGSLIGALSLAMRVITEGPVFALGEQFFADHFSVLMLVLTAFIALMTTVHSARHVRIEATRGRMTPLQLRLYHAAFQLFVFAVLLMLATNNLGILWVAIEAATLTMVLLISVYRTQQSLESAWKYFVLCGVGIAQALFGTILLYMAAQKVLGSGMDGLLWTTLHAVRTELEPTVVSIAFVFLMVGYGTKVGLVPLHNWLPDAHAHAPAPVAAALSAMLLNVALYALVRCRVLADPLESGFAGQLMMAFGLLSAVVATIGMARQRDLSRLYAYSSIAHMGYATFAFGVGGPLGALAGLLHMSAHALVKSALFYTCGHIAQRYGSALLADIGGLARTQPGLAWTLLVGTLAALGLPPFGLFASIFLLLNVAVGAAPWMAAILAATLIARFAILLRKMQRLLFGLPPVVPAPLPLPPAYLPIALPLAGALMLGLYTPPFLAAWYGAAAKLLS